MRRASVVAGRAMSAIKQPTRLRPHRAYVRDNKTEQTDGDSDDVWLNGNGNNGNGNGVHASSSGVTDEAMAAKSQVAFEELQSFLKRQGARGASSKDVLSRIQSPVEGEMQQQTDGLRNIVGERHPLLSAASEHLFQAGGKRVRPLIAILVAKATRKLYGLADVTSEHIRLAMITEMIHTASLVHDDVLDDCELRRGNSTVHSLYGTRVAVLAGDFLFAQSSWFLANLNNLEVIKLISQVIADFADGEIAQASSLFDVDITVEKYLDKSFYKTASLIAASCRSAAVFSDCTEGEKSLMYDYGCNLGLAFQIVDDILDFTQTEEELGKPQGQDLASGNITAPAILVLEQSPRLRELLKEDRLQSEGSLQEAMDLVFQKGGIEKAKDLARHHGDLALRSLDVLPECEEKESLQLMVEYVLERIS